MRTDFPVPAEPVKNTLLPSSITALTTDLCSSLRNVSATLELLGSDTIIDFTERSEEALETGGGCRGRLVEAFSSIWVTTDELFSRDVDMEEVVLLSAAK